MPGKQSVGYAYPGLAVEATPLGEERGVYFTDEHIRVRFIFTNQSDPPKRIKGAVTVFYGFGPSGLEGKTPDIVELDIDPGRSIEVVALDRLLGIQGNGVIGLAMPQGKSWDETPEEVILRPPPAGSLFHTLYTFTVMDREYYRRFHEYPAKLSEQIARSQNQTRTLTILLVVLTVIFVLQTLLQALGVFP